MNKAVTKFISVFTTVFIIFFALSFGEKVKAGAFFDIINGKPGVPGTVYSGETPPNLDPEKPVLVFVQGLFNSSSIWWDDNDIYEKAYENGYQTAFVELYDSSGNPRSNWVNGELLARQLEQIYEHFGGKKLAVIGYSKGGIDTQTAVVHYGKNDIVSNIFTIGTPHYGSPLADLAFSDWTWWLSSLLGTRNEGVYSLQTGVMEHFRQITDQSKDVVKTPYYMIAGNDWGSVGTPTWFGGLYLSLWGENDGLVPLSSAFLPYGDKLATLNVDHLHIQKGENIFPFIHQQLNEKNIQENKHLSNTYSMNTAFSPQMTQGNMLLRGGKQEGKATESFLVEDQVDKVTIDWIGAHPIDEIELIDPDHQTVDFTVQTWQDDNIFKGAYHHTIEIERPKQGTWEVKTVAKQSTAYALTVLFKSQQLDSLKVKTNQENGLAKIKAKKEFAQKIKMDYNITFIPADKVKNKGKIIRSIKQSTLKEINIPFQKKGVYQMTMDITGTTPNGAPYQRTIVQSFYHDPEK